MAATPKAEKPAEPQEVEVDYMADAPKARPYSEAITDEHRKVLEEAGIPIQ